MVGFQDLEYLPRRLRRLLPLIADGADNQQLAAAFTLAVTTIEQYISDIYAATGCANRVELVLRTRAWLGLDQSTQPAEQDFGESTQSAL
jgi:DNA-binding NarL/FixJ family response regulator